MSFEVMRSELDLFKKLQFQGSIENSQFIEIRPTSSIQDSSTIEFEIPSSSEEYLDLQNVHLFIKGKVVSDTGADFAAGQDNKYGIINYALNTIFDQLTVYLGGTLVSQSSKTYHYLSYIEALTENNLILQDTLLKSGGFISDYQTDNYNPEAVNDDLFNIVKRSKEFSLYGRVHGGIFRCDRLLLNGIPLHLTFSLASPEFIFQTTAATATPTIPEVQPKLKLTSVSLFVRRVKVVPDILNAHSKILLTTKAIYPIKRPLVKVLNLAQGGSTFVLDNVFMGQLPCKIIFGIVTANSFAGKYLRNPFGFKHFDLTFVALHLNGELFPKTPYTPDFRDNHDNFERIYYDSMVNLGALYPGQEPCISTKTYMRGFCLFAFNLNSDQEITNENDYINIPKEGFLNIELRFRSALTEALKLVVYAQFDNVIEIDEARNVTVDYS